MRRSQAGPFALPEEVTDEVNNAVPRRVPNKARHLADRLAEAAEAYERDSYQDALRMLSAIRREVRSAAIEELYGLTCYRIGRWDEAARRLKEVASTTGSLDQHPVIMDCYRAQGKRLQVNRLYDELLQASPGAELLAEARIVLAESMAESGDVPGAIDLLKKAARRVAHPRGYHIRQWYVLGDLYERVGDLQRATTYFSNVLSSGGETYDAEARLSAIT